MMKKLILLVIAAILSGLIVSAVGQSAASGSLNRIRIDVNNGEGITLDMKDSSIRLRGWNKDYIEVQYGFSDKKNPGKRSFDLEQKGNSIQLKNFQRSQAVSTTYQLQTWLTLLQFGKYNDPIMNDIEGGMGINSFYASNDFLIFVPEDTPLTLIANYFKAYNCTFAKSTAPGAEIRESRIGKGYVGEGESIIVRDCKINKDSTFTQRKTEMRDNSYQEVEK